MNSKWIALLLVALLSDTALAESRGPAPWRAVPTASIDVQGRIFSNGAVQLSGTLYVPKVEGRVPLVIVFHAASAPTRDFPLYRHVIEALPPLGVAVFVFDRRGSGQSGGKLEDSDYNMLADDGIAAQKMVAMDARIDPKRIGFWGLSQGGWLSLLAASRSPESAFAISISAPMTTPDVQMIFASQNILRIKGFSQADIDQATATRTAVDDFMRGKRDRASTQSMLDAAAARPWFQHIYMGRRSRIPTSRVGRRRSSTIHWRRWTRFDSPRW
jgi:pimeloyl-ACP methyl ester carboxylesterase